MAVNKPTGDNARKGAVKKRTQLKNPLTKTSTKRNKTGGHSWPSRKAPRSLRVSVRRSDGPVLHRNHHDQRPDSTGYVSARGCPVGLLEPLSAHALARHPRATLAAIIFGPCFVRVVLTDETYP